MSDLELLDDTEQDVSETHSKLLDAVSQLDKGQRVKKAERSEPTLEVSEFHLVKSGISDVDTVQVRDLVKILGKKGRHLDVTKTLESAKKKIRILKKPLEKPVAERIKRIVGFENTKNELKKWNAIITRNRVAEALQFPLNQPSMKLEPSTQFVQRFRLRSELEKELDVLEPQKENIEQKPDKFKLTLQEIIMKRNEAARIRAQQSYKEAKAHRQNKIKSKKFHRVQKKEQIKLQLKEFERLQKTDPDVALEKLEQLDKSRAEERMSLRHKNTGKWAKSKQIMAKYDKETRQELAQQLSISRELTQKLKKSTNTSDEEEVEEEGINDNAYVRSSNQDKENPWISNVKTASEIDQFISSYRKYWDDQHNQLKDKQLDTSNMNKIEVETKQKKISSENLKNSNISEDYSVISKAESFKIQCNEEIEKEKSNNQRTSSEHLKSFSTFQDSDGANKMELSKKPNHEKNYTTEGHNNEITERNLCNDTVKKKSPDTDKIIDKKARMHKSNSNNITATSSWNVESLKNDHAQSIFHSLTSTISNSEKINEVFDLIEDKMNDQIKLKLQQVNEKYNKVKAKRKSKIVTEYETDNFDGLGMQAKKLKPIIDSSLIERTNNKNAELDVELENTKNIKNSTLCINKSNVSEVEIDPNKYINVKPKQLITDIPADISGGIDMLDDMEDTEKGYNVINEAFADDDVVEEFRKEKEEEVEKSRLQDIDLTLPGWGSWGGKNVKTSKRKRKRFILKIPKDAPRKDENKGDVIIFEEDKPKMKEHLVNELPHPFTSVQDYEASLRMPIGRNFIPEKSFQKLIKPPIKTSMGKVIEPMNDDVLIKKEGNHKRKFIPKEKKQKKKKNKIEKYI